MTKNEAEYVRRFERHFASNVGMVFERLQQRANQQMSALVVDVVNQQMTDAQRIEAVQKFTGGVSHQVQAELGELVKESLRIASENAASA
jgi:hypothetical protein